MKKQISSRYYGRVSQAVSTLTTVPAPVAVSGTITTVGKQFTTSADDTVAVGDWIFYSTQSLVRMVVSMDTARKGLLSDAFGGDLTTATVTKVLKNTIAPVWAIDIKVTGATSIIDGLPFVQNDTLRFGVPTTSEVSMPAPMQPLVIDGATNKTCNAIINRFIH